MRIFYSDEAPIDTLLQIASGPVLDGDLVSKPARDDFVRHGLVARCEGYNIITAIGRSVIRMLRLTRTPPSEQIENLKVAFAEHSIPWPTQN